MGTGFRKKAIQSLEAKTGMPSIVEALEKAAALTEHAAYEFARFRKAPSITELILTAARLERIAQDISAEDKEGE